MGFFLHSVYFIFCFDIYDFFQVSILFIDKPHDIKALLIIERSDNMLRIFFLRFCYFFVPRPRFS